MFAIVEGIECRLTTRSRSKYAKIAKKNLLAYEIDVYWIYRDVNCEAFVLAPLAIRLEKRMRKLWYKDFDYDSKTYALVKCYK